MYAHILSSAGVDPSSSLASREDDVPLDGLVGTPEQTRVPSDRRRASAIGGTPPPGAPAAAAASPPGAVGFARVDNLHEVLPLMNRSLAERGYPAPLELLLPNADDLARTCNAIFLMLRDREAEVAERARWEAERRAHAAELQALESKLRRAEARTGENDRRLAARLRDAEANLERAETIVERAREERDARERETRDLANALKRLEREQRKRDLEHERLKARLADRFAAGSKPGDRSRGGGSDAARIRILDPSGGGGPRPLRRARHHLPDESRRSVSSPPGGFVGRAALLDDAARAVADPGPSPAISMELHRSMMAAYEAKLRATTRERDRLDALVADAGLAAAETPVLGFADGDGDPTLKGSKAEEGTKGSEDPAAASTSPGRVFASPSFAARAEATTLEREADAEVARASSSSAAEAFEFAFAPESRSSEGHHPRPRTPTPLSSPSKRRTAARADADADASDGERIEPGGSSSPPRARDPSSERDDFGSVSDDLRDPHPSGGDAPLARDPPASPTEIAVRWHEREHARLLEVLEREKTLATTTAKASPRRPPGSSREPVGASSEEDEDDAFVEVDPGSDDEEPVSDDEGLRREFGAVLRFGRSGAEAEAEAEARRLRWGDPDPDPARAADEGLGTRDSGRGTRDSGLASPAATRRAKFLADEEARRRQIDAEEEERGGTGDGERDARARGGEPGSTLSSRAAPSSPASPLDALLARHLRLGRDRAELARGPPRGKGDWLERRRRRRENEGASERAREDER